MPLAFAQVLAASCERFPSAVVVSDGHASMTRLEMERHTNQLARAFALRGVTSGAIVSLVLPSDRWLLCAAVACWKLGATPQPLSPRMPEPELQAVLEVTRPALVVSASAWKGGHAAMTLDVSSLDALDDAPLPILISPVWKAPTSGGSTGRPKVILSTQPADAELQQLTAGVVRLGPTDAALITAPMHHNAPFQFATVALLAGARVVLVEKFDAADTLRMLQEKQISWTYLVPTMMSRIAKLPAALLREADLSRLHTVLHMAAPCPAWVKDFWIELLGPDAIWELYSGTEAQACTLISGTEWLTHRGSVGRPLLGELEVRDETGAPVPPGMPGEVWMRSTTGRTYTYLGATAKQCSEGWESLGDMGWLDGEGFLYLNDRAADMVLVGGVNIYPAEVEAVLEEHPDVVCATVIGLPDDDLGSRLHALINGARDVTDEELQQWCAARLSGPKVPRCFERVDSPLRDDAAKVRRSALRSARLSSAAP